MLGVETTAHMDDGKLQSGHPKPANGYPFSKANKRRVLSEEWCYTVIQGRKTHESFYLIVPQNYSVGLSTYKAGE